MGGFRRVCVLLLLLLARGSEAHTEDDFAYRARQNATRLFFTLRGDYDPRTDTVHATQEQNLEVRRSCIA
jgi:hypothetical protein